MRRGAFTQTTVSATSYVISLTLCIAVAYGYGASWADCSAQISGAEMLDSALDSVPYALLAAVGVFLILSTAACGAAKQRPWPANLWRSWWGLTVIPLLLLFWLYTSTTNLKSPCELMYSRAEVNAMLALSGAAILYLLGLITYSTVFAWRAFTRRSDAAFRKK